MMDSNLASYLAGQYATKKLQHFISKSSLSSRSGNSAPPASIRQVNLSHDLNDSIPTNRIGRGGYASVYRVALSTSSSSASEYSSSVEGSSISFASSSGGSSSLSSSTYSSSSFHTSFSSEYSLEDAQNQQPHQDQNDPYNFYALKCLDPTIRFAAVPYHIAASDLVCEGYLLSKLNHPNIIKLHGVSNGPIHRAFLDHDVGYFLVLDLLHPNDTLRDRLCRWSRQEERQQKQEQQQGGGLLSRRSFIRMRRRRNEKTASASTSLNAPPPLLRRIETVALDIVKAMEYLHSMQVVHRDLKPENIGFDYQTNTLKLFDFGFARELSTLDTSEIAGTLYYQSPEALQGFHSGYPSDVYSFGILLWELCTLKKIYKQLGNGRGNGQKVTKEQYKHLLVTRKWRPSLRGIPSQQLKNLISKCWDNDQLKRPTFTQIRKELQVYIAGESPNATVAASTKKLSFLSLEFEKDGSSEHAKTPVVTTKTKNTPKHPPQHRRFRSMFKMMTNHQQFHPKHDDANKKQQQMNDLTQYAGVSCSPASTTTATASTDSITI